MFPQQTPTPKGDGATTGRHRPNAATRVHVGCLIKVWPAPAGRAGKHTRPDQPASGPAGTGDVTNATSGGAW
ncbi:hypothetical protein GCM10009634_27830 [Saccharothrix xinjiangensis]